MFNIIDLSVSKEVALRRNNKDVYSIVRRRIMRTDLFILIRTPGENLSGWVRKEVLIAKENFVPIIEAHTDDGHDSLNDKFWREVAAMDLERNELDRLLLLMMHPQDGRTRPLRRSAQSLFGGRRRKLTLDGRITFRHYHRPSLYTDDMDGPID